ncbi:MAG: hypothetical protein HOB12_09675, partial [Gemmatimonadales bacterium]|nr:hypothetical protein [Gemmatimonadales bacterium]
MGEFAVFILIIFTAVWSSIGLGWFMFGRNKEIESGDGNSDLLLHAVREELEAVSTRLMRVEDDLSFFNELHAPEARSALAKSSAASSAI